MTLSLFACSTTIVTKYKLVKPPIEFICSTPPPAFVGKTVDDLKLYTIDLQDVIKDCNLKGESLDTWYLEVERNLNEGID